MATTFLSALKWLVPSWLYDEITQSLAMQIDEHVARARAGLEAGMPSRAGDDALALIGKDRRIPRGRTETSAHYAQRLIRWRYPRGHRTRGSAFALLEQVSEYFGGLAIWVIDYNGTRHDRSAAGAETFSYGNSWTWDTDTRKARFWIGLLPGAAILPQPSFGDPALWGGLFGTPGYTIGQLGVTPDDVDAIRGLFARPTPWKPAGTLQQWLCLALDGSNQTPDATWARWSKNVAGTQVRSRYAGWRYWALYPALSIYAGDPTNYPTLYTEVAGTTYGGNATSFPATIPLTRSGAGPYAGVATFPANLKLPDDGSAP